VTAPKKEHPAVFHKGILERCRLALVEEVERTGKALRVFDPFAGVGGVHDLGGDYGNRHVYTFGLELEPEWAGARIGTKVGDATAPPDWAKDMDVIVSSPCYGNRMADSHDAKDACPMCEGSGVGEGDPGELCPKCKGTGLSVRHTYTHVLGRKLSAGSAGNLQWGAAYRMLHETAMQAMVRQVLTPGGLILWNVKNHIRNGQVQRVVEWHLNAWLVFGCTVEWVWPCAARGIQHGANGSLRAPNEMLMALRGPK